KGQHSARGGAVMRALHTIVILLLAVSVSFFVAGSAIADDNDQPGVASSDTSEDVVDESPDLAAAPVPMSPSGPAAPGSYSTEVKSSEEVGLDDGLKMVSSTAPGTFALSGAVIDGSTGQPVTGAIVTVTVISQLPPDSDPITFTTGSAGAFAFINVPPRDGTHSITFHVTEIGRAHV